MVSKLSNSVKFQEWLKDIKTRIKHLQIKAAVNVNRELLNFYWDLGKEISLNQDKYKWGDNFLGNLSKELSAEFPEMRGFSKRNIELIRQWHRFWSDMPEFTKQAVSQISDIKSQITQIPWGHNIAIIAKCKKHNEAIYYLNNTILHNWSRNVLIHQIESGLFEREGKATTNFIQTLPKPNSDLAIETLKEPYIFDFLSLSKNYNERDLEGQLTQHITKFLLELGAGFAFIGKQLQLQVSDRTFFIDLLFYHTKLHCYVVVELKTGSFEPEYAGKLNFYVKAVDEQIKDTSDQPTIGLLICKSKDKLIAEYALSDIHKPIGISAYQLTKSLPDNLKKILPSTHEIESEFMENTNDEN